MTASRALRTRLVVAFVTIAGVVLVLFGIVAYHIARDSGLQQELAILEGVARQEALSLSAGIRGRYTGDAVRAVLEARVGGEFVAVAVDVDGGLISARSLTEILGGDASAFPWGEVLADRDNRGHIRFRGDNYLWQRTVVPASPFKLVVLRRSAVADQAPIEAVGPRLAMTGFVVVWVAVWGALILSGAITRRLDEQNKALVHQALHDALTDLPNRVAVYNRLQQCIVENPHPARSTALLVMDLDRFKEVNDTLGHDHGDALLRQVGTRIQRVLREYDTVARLGGDEFAAVLPNVGTDLAAQCARRIIEAIADPFVVDGFTIDVSISVGIAYYPEHGADAASLARRAEVAMYHAKRQTSGFATYSQEADPYNLRRLTLLGELRRALEDGELMLYYQPKIDMRTRQAFGVEALLRWQHPKHGFIPPDEFIPLAEQGGLMRPITLWVINTALRQWHAWKQMGLDLQVAVNLSARNLQDATLPAEVSEMLIAWDAPPEVLELEITESATMAEPEHAMRILTELSRMRVGLSIDDFGTGHSSLAYLKSLPVNRIKVDKSFVLDMITDENDAIIVRATIDLAHNLGMRVTAEGVETQDVWDLLEILGCDVVQGYFTGRPQPSDQLVKSLLASPYSPVARIAGAAQFRGMPDRADSAARHAVVTPLRPNRR
ncbi:MAG TPA: bifunctional diguanylate cyclase/phosphodiesterase [Acidiferrobacterales bacterium]